MVIEEYKGIRAIYPPTEGVISCGCSSCGRDIKTDMGFVELAKRTYLCASCTKTAIGGIRASYLLEWAQNKYRNSTSKTT